MKELDEEKKEDIIKFLTENHEDIINELNNELNNEIFSDDECLIDDEGNKYSCYGTVISLSDFNENEDKESEFKASDILLDKMKEMKIKSKINK